MCEASTRNARSVADRTLLVPVTAECRARRGHRGRRCALSELRDGDQRDQRESSDKFPHDTSPCCGTLSAFSRRLRSFNRERVINCAVSALPSCANLAGIHRSCSFSTHYCGDGGAKYESRSRALPSRWVMAEFPRSTASQRERPRYAVPW